MALITSELMIKHGLWTGYDDTNWIWNFNDDFPDGVETTVDGWVSLLKRGYGKVVGTLRYIGDNYIVNLTGADLSEMNLENAYLEKATMINVNLTNSNLENACLDYTNLTNSNLTNTNLQGAFMRRTILDECNVCRANFSRATMYMVSENNIVSDATTKWPMPSKTRMIYEGDYYGE